MRTAFLRFAGSLLALSLAACSEAARDPAQPDLSVQAICSNSVAVNDIESPVPAGSSNGASFRVTNLLSMTTSNTASCTYTGHVKCLNLTPTSFTLAPGASRLLTFTLVATSPGTGTVTGSSCGGSATKTVVVQ